MEISSSLLAHIGGDAYISGSGWERYSLQCTLQYLLQYLDTIELSEALTNLKQQFTSLAANIQEIICLTGNIELGLKEFIQRKVTEINNLPVNAFVDLHGGWSNYGNDGHSMLYRFSKPAEDTIYFEVLNSGGGIHFHLQTSSLDRELYSAIKPYKLNIPEDELDKNEMLVNLADFIERLLIPRILKHPARSNKIYSENYLYSKILPSISFVNGEQVLPSLSDEATYTSGQLSETCAERILHQRLKQCFTNIEEYRIFISQYIIYATNEYLALKLEYIDTEIAQDVIFNCEQIINSIATTSQTITQTKEKIKAVKQTVDQITDVKQQNIEIASLPSHAVNSEPTNTVDIEIQTTQNLDNYPLGYRIQERTDFTPKSISLSPPPVPITINAEIPLTSLKEWLHRMNMSDNKYAKLEITKNFMLLVVNQRFFKDYLANEDIDSLDNLLDRLQKTQKAYIYSVDLLGIKLARTLPEVIFAKLCFLLLKAEIAYAIDMKTRPSHAYYDIRGSIFKNILTTISTTKYSYCTVTFDPEIDAAMCEIQNYIETQPTLHSLYFCLNNYKYVLNAFSDQKPQLIEAYDNFIKGQKYIFSKNQTQLHQYIQDNNYRELWFVLECVANERKHADKIKSIPKLAEIIKIVKQILELETESCNYHNLQQLNNIDVTPALNFEYKDYKLNFNHPSTKLQSLYFLTNNQNVIFPRDNIDNFELVRCISYSREFTTRSANTIQTKLHFDNEIKCAKPTTEETLQIRDHYQIRSSKLLQRPLTVSYYRRNLYLLKSAESFKFLYDSLFAGFNLHDKLNKQLVSQVDELIIDGLNENIQQKQPTLAYAEFIGLSFLYYRYLATQDPEQHTNRLKSLCNTIDEKIQVTTACKQSILYKLYLYKFLASTHIFKSSQTPSQSQIQQYITENLSAYFYIINFKSFNQETGYITHQLNQATSYFQYYLRNQTLDFYQPLIPAALSTINIHYSNLEVTKSTKNYLIVSDETQVLNIIDVYSGYIYDADYFNLTALPEALLLRIKKYSLGITASSVCYKSANKCLYRIKNPEIEIYNVDSYSRAFHKFSVFKWWQVNGCTDWYEVIDSFNRQLPSILSRQSDIVVWSKCTTDTTAKEILITKGQTPAYISVSDSKAQHEFYEIDPTNNMPTAWRLVINHSEIIKTVPNLLSFEDQEFITVLQHAHTEKLIKINFVRYNLSLIYTLNTGKIFIADTDFEFDLNVKPFKQNLACLTFTNKSGLQKSIIAIQELILPEGKDKNTRKLLTHDTNFTAKENAFKEDRKVNASAGPFDYFASEKYYFVTLREGKFQTSKSEVALYLAYLYIGTRDFDRAYSMLSECENRLGGISNNIIELDYIIMIVEQLEKISHPKVIACQVYTLAILTEYLLREDEITETCSTQSMPSDSENLRYEKLQAQMREKFTAELTNKISTCLYKYIHMLRNLEKRFILHDRIFNNFLIYLQAKSSLPIHGTIAYFMQFFSLKKLLIEKQDLEELPELTAYQGQRLTSINDKLAVTKAVSKRSSRLQVEEISLDLQQYKIKEVTLLKEKVSEEVALSQLRYNLSSELNIADILHKNFYIYVSILSKSDDSSRNKLKVRNFCKNLLIANMHLKYAEDQLSLLLVNILYRISYLSTEHLEEFRENNEGENENAGSDSDSDSDSGENEKIEISFLEEYFEDKKCPPIEVLQSVNIYTEDLEAPKLTTQKITAKLPKKSPIQLTNVKYPHLNIFELIPNKQLFDRYIENQQQYVQELTSLKAEIKDDATFPDEQIPNYKEWVYKKKAGSIELKYLSENYKIAQEFLLNNQQLLGALIESAKNLLSSLQVRSDQELQVITQQIESSCLQKLSIIKLIKIYMTGDRGEYKKFLNLTNEQIESLDSKIHQYLHTNLRIQHIKRLIKDVEKAISKPEDLHTAYKVLTSLLQENHELTIKNRKYTAIQYFDGILLRAIQLQTLRTLNPSLEGNKSRDNIAKITPGGGKTTYILPIWANEMADGQNLVIVEVPRALLHANYTDARHSSVKWFEQSVSKFDFSRESRCELADLEKVFELFSTTKVMRGYIITCPEAMKSLLLKCTEILDSKPDEENTALFADWQKKTLLADNIMQLLACHGYALIDEVHKGLDNNDLLIFTTGKVVAADQQLINLSIKFYQFLSKIILLDANGNEYAVTDIINNPKLIPSWDIVSTQIFQALNDTNSPILDITAKYHISLANIINWIKNDLAEEEHAVTAVIERMEDTDKDRLAFYKAQLNQVTGVEHFEPILKRTLYSKYRVKYGPSQNLTKDPVKRATAIPYSGNNVSRESSRFATVNEALNYTIQSLLITGVPETLIKTLVSELKDQAILESTSSPDKRVLPEDNTRAGVLFTELMQHGKSSQITKLSQVDPESSEHIQIIHNACTTNHLITYDLLKRYILREVTSNSDTMGCNPHQHVDMYNAVQGTTATEDNHCTFHNRFHLDQVKSLAEDGLVVQAILHKNSPVHSVDYQNTDSLLKLLFSKLSYGKKVHSLIDIAAMIQGKLNPEVALYIAQNIRKANPSIKYVLYFKDQELWATNCGYPNKEINIGTTTSEEEILTALDCTPEEYFTYYDQIHTTGTNIRQAEDACALTLVDHKTKISDTVQGTMRMRGFVTGKQTVEYIVPASMQIFENNLPALLDSMISLSQNVLQTEVFISGLEQLTNTVRNYFRLQTFAQSSALGKHQKLQDTREFFFESHNAKYFSQYGKIIKIDVAQTILTARQQNLLNNPNIAECDKKQLTEIMQRIIKQTVANCALLQLNYHTKQDQAVEEQLQVEQQIKEDLRDLELNFEDQNYQPKYTSHYDLASLRELNSLTVERIPHSPFGSNFYLSRNFAITCTEHTSFKFDETCKSAHLIYFNWNNERGITAILITVHEYENLFLHSHQLTDEDWVTDLSGNVIVGSIPKDVDDNLEEYKGLFEQALLFNGEIQPLIALKRHYWLNTDPEHKIAYFEQTIRPFRRCRDQDICKLRSILLNVNQQAIYQYINASLFNPNLVSELLTLPELRGPDKETDRQITKSLVDSLALIKLNPANPNDFDIEKFLGAHDLPLPVAATVSLYLDHIRILINCMQNLGSGLEGEDLIVLCKILNIEPNANNLEVQIIEGYLNASFISSIDIQQVQIFLSRPSCTKELALRILKSGKITGSNVIIEVYKYLKSQKSPNLHEEVQKLLDLPICDIDFITYLLEENIAINDEVLNNILTKWGGNLVANNPTLIKTIIISKQDTISQATLRTFIQSCAHTEHYCLAINLLTQKEQLCAKINVPETLEIFKYDLRLVNCLLERDTTFSDQLITAALDTHTDTSRTCLNNVSRKIISQTSLSPQNALKLISGNELLNSQDLIKLCKINRLFNLESALDKTLIHPNCDDEVITEILQHLPNSHLFLINLEQIQRLSKNHEAVSLISSYPTDRLNTHYEILRSTNNYDNFVACIKLRDCPYILSKHEGIKNTFNINKYSDLRNTCDKLEETLNSYAKRIPKKSQKYSEAIKTTFEIHRSLRSILAEENIDSSKLIKLKQQIEEQSPKISELRGIKQRLLDVVNAILIVLCALQYAYSKGKHFRLFVAYSEPEKALQEVNKQTIICASA